MDKQQQQKNNVEKNEIRRDSYAKLNVGEIIISPDSEEAEKTKELDDALVTSMVLETPKISGQRPPMELSKEMKAALKVLDDNLRYEVIDILVVMSVCLGYGILISLRNGYKSLGFCRKITS